MFVHLLVSFFELATLTKHCILRYETYFFMFCIFHFFLKKCEKLSAKLDPEQTSQKRDKLGPKMGPKSLKIEMEIC